MFALGTLEILCLSNLSDRHCVVEKHLCAVSASTWRPQCIIVTEVCLLLQAEETKRNITIGSSVPSRKHPSPVPADASANERRPAEESRPNLQRPQADLQAPHVQAQPQVHSQAYVLLSPTLTLCSMHKVKLGYLCLLIFASTNRFDTSFPSSMHTAWVSSSLRGLKLPYEYKLCTSAVQNLPWPASGS